VRWWSPAKAVVVCASFAGAVLSVPGVAAADTPVDPASVLVHATPENECKLNVRAGSDVGAALQGTLTCDTYATCVSATDTQCGPYVTGGVYTCVGPDKKTVTDNRWAEVRYREPKQKAYIAAACAAFRK
jgi:hypothetical protein